MITLESQFEFYVQFIKIFLRLNRVKRKNKRTFNIYVNL